jgi:hypothetical protein
MKRERIEGRFIWINELYRALSDFGVSRFDAAPLETISYLTVLALLCGSDYTTGYHHIGPKTLLSQFFDKPVKPGLFWTHLVSSPLTSPLPPLSTSTDDKAILTFPSFDGAREFLSQIFISAFSPRAQACVAARVSRVHEMLLPWEELIEIATLFSCGAVPPPWPAALAELHRVFWVLNYWQNAAHALGVFPSPLAEIGGVPLWGWTLALPEHTNLETGLKRSISTDDYKMRYVGIDTEDLDREEILEATKRLVPVRIDLVYIARRRQPRPRCGTIEGTGSPQAMPQFVTNEFATRCKNAMVDPGLLLYESLPSHIIACLKGYLGE